MREKERHRHTKLPPRDAPRNVSRKRARDGRVNVDGGAPVFAPPAAAIAVAAAVGVTNAGGTASSVLETVIHDAAWVGVTTGAAATTTAAEVTVAVVLRVDGGADAKRYKRGTLAATRAAEAKSKAAAPVSSLPGRTTREDPRRWRRPCELG